MPRRARSWVAIFRRSLPLHSTRPPAALSRPITLFMSVVLPAPLRPMSPTIVPSGTSSDTPRRICMEAIATLRFCTLSTRGPYHVALHFRVGKRRLRRRIGDDAAVVEGEHALREAAHHLHVVLDEEHGRALRAHCVEHHLHDAELLLGRDAAG